MAARPAVLLKLCILAAVLAGLVVAARPSHAAFPGANGKIAFTTHRDGNWEIYVMNADGSGQTNLTNDPAMDGSPAGPPTWSADGSKIAFASDRDGNIEVYVMNANGSGLTRLTNNGAADGMPAWSPDGSKIAFVSTRDGNLEIYVMNADGSNPQRLTNDPAGDYFPVWSPNGTKIAFHSTRQDPSPNTCIPNCIIDIYTMPPNGSGVTNLTNDGKSSLADWSPDGSKIAFERHDPGEFHVYLMNADGSNQTNITTNPAIPAAEPAWSPDGTRIAFDGASSEIYAMNANGTNRTQLTNTNDISSFPDWQPLHPPALGGVAEYPPRSRNSNAIVLALAAAFVAGAVALGGAVWRRRVAGR